MGSVRLRYAVLWLLLLFIYMQLCMYKAEARPFPSPRSRFLEFAPLAPAVSSSSTTSLDSSTVGGGVEGNVEKLVGDEKRKVHTGPNPLHNNLGKLENNQSHSVQCQLKDRVNALLPTAMDLFIHIVASGNCHD
ncbi:hypothetical protein ACLOJK_007294 [Asimina triloba]